MLGDNIGDRWNGLYTCPVSETGHIVSDVSTETPEVDPYAAAFAAELRAERARKQVTFDELAKTSGINKRTLMRLFDGERDLRAKQLVLISGALDVAPQDIITRAMAAVSE